MKNALLVFPRMKLKPFGEQTYLAHLLKALLHVTNDWQFTTYAVGFREREEHLARLAQIDSTGEAKHLWNRLPQTVYERLITNKLPVPDASLFRKADIVHSFNAQLIPASTKNFVLTIHDLSNLRFLAGNDSEERNENIRSALKRLTSKARAIITISQFTKNEVVELLEIEPSKITVIHNGVDTKHFRAINENDRTKIESFLFSKGIHKPYLLHMGGASPRKNLLRLLNAYEMFRKTSQLDCALVVCGLTNPPSDVADAIANCPYSADVHLPGYLPENELLWIVQSALMLVFPSLYEGFGMPPLEAMACGVPTVLANSSSLPEVGGDAAIYCDPLDTESMANAILKMATDNSAREGCIKIGKARAEAMSWDKNARQTLEVYAKAID